MEQKMNSVLLYAGEIGCAVTPSDTDMAITMDFEARFLRRKRLVAMHVTHLLQNTPDSQSWNQL